MRTDRTFEKRPSAFNQSCKFRRSLGCTSKEYAKECLTLGS